MSAVDAVCCHASRVISHLDVTQRHWIATCQQCGYVEWDRRSYRGATLGKVLDLYEMAVEIYGQQQGVDAEMAKVIAGWVRRDMAGIANRVRSTGLVPELWHFCIDPNDPNDRYGTLSHHEAHDVEDSMLVIGPMMWDSAVQVACEPTGNT